MKKIIMGILCGILAFFPIICTAAYVIHLRDGRSFTTSEYREEGDQIKFKRFGGVIGIPKDQVKEIEEIEDLLEEKEKAEPTKEDVGLSAKKQAAEKEGGAEAEEKVKEGKEDVPEKAAKDQGAKREKEQEKLVNKYLEEFDLYKTKFKTVDIMTKEELNNFYIELNTFKKAVLTKRLGGFFANHLREVYSMQERIQENMNWISKATN